jgi:tRNA(Arg) A34 adenosine deaminase TadA
MSLSLYDVIYKLSNDRNIVSHTKKNILLTAHVSAIFNIHMDSIISTGTNNGRGINHGMYGTFHAEIDVVRKLPKRESNKKLMKVNLLVAKTSSTHCLSDSKPCIKCVNELMIYPQMYGYRIKKIYYTNSKGEIICRKLIDLIKDTDQHVTKCYREKGYNGRFISYDPTVGCYLK